MMEPDDGPHMGFVTEESGLKRVSEALSFPLSGTRHDDGLQNTSALRQLALECSEIKRQVDKLNTTVALLVRNASHKVTSK